MSHNCLNGKGNTKVTLQPTQLDPFFISDINECLSNTHGCEHKCTNNDGSFTCSCNTGYEVDTDRKSCKGKYSRVQLKAHAAILSCTTWR